MFPNKIVCQDKMPSISKLCQIEGTNFSFNVTIYFSCQFVVPTSGFAYSLEALSDDEEAEEEENEEGERTPITQEQLAAALQVGVLYYLPHILQKTFAVVYNNGYTVLKSVTTRSQGSCVFVV